MSGGALFQRQEDVIAGLKAQLIGANKAIDASIVEYGKLTDALDRIEFIAKGEAVRCRATGMHDRPMLDILAIIERALA